LGLATLAAVITRTRRFRARNPLSHSDLVAALTAVGCALDPAGRWHPPTGVVAPDRYRVIVTLAAGLDLTRAEMIRILLSAGYLESSATGRMSSSHPLFRRTGPDRYRLVGGRYTTVMPPGEMTPTRGIDWRPVKIFTPHRHLPVNPSSDVRGGRR